MASALPDIATNPDAVLGDNAAWRHGRPPSYKKTRQYFEQTKQKNWAAGSLESIVENLVKNWEIEASYKTSYNDWRTVDKDVYKFSANGGANVSGPDMVTTGTYNALLSESKFYSPTHNDFTESHKCFKRMMPVFAWEVLEVYSGPPTVSFKWRHWGEMKNDYVGMNSDGKKCRVKAHGGVVNIEGTLTAKVNDKLQIQSIEVWFDPMSFFNEATKGGAEVIIEDGAVTPDADSAGKCPFAGSLAASGASAHL